MKYPTCEMEFMDHADLISHKQDFEHATNYTLDDCRKYNNIVMLPGK